MRYMGIDYGKKRVGVALSDEGGQFALPNSVLANDSELVQKIKDICTKNAVSLIVLGDSKNYKGEENVIMISVRAFAKKLEIATNVPIVFEPEFLTSAEAERISTQRPNRGEGERISRTPKVKNKMLDASAAALILKSYIDKNNIK